MFQLLKPKTNQYEDIFEKSKYLLSYRISLFLVFSLTILSVILFLIFKITHSYLTIGGWTLSLVSFLYLSKTGKYKAVMYVFNILGAALCIFTLYYVKDQPRIVDGFWMIISSLLTFYTLGNRMGIIITAIHIIALSSFYAFFLNDQIELIKVMGAQQVFAYALNILICFTAIIYLVWQNIKTTNLAEKELRDAKSFLEEQFDLIQQQNEEKTILLKEIHHRVKNNLQVIVSLLRLQLRDIKDKDEVSKFTESINRVMVMSLIHEKLYQTEDFAQIDLNDYFNTLIRDMLFSYQVEKNIDLKINCEAEDIGLKPVVPLALLFNELFSNSIKYAFDSVTHPSITISLTSKNQDCIDFEYKDNGTWKEPQHANTFGLELIDTLSEQLNGTYQRNTENGTAYHFYFEKINA